MASCGAGARRADRPPRRRRTAIAFALFVTEKAVGEQISSIFAKLDLLPSDDDNRRVRAVLAYLQAAPGVR
jgi:DNA-binding NarL/FixJ family response regulator